MSFEEQIVDGIYIHILHRGNRDTLDTWLVAHEAMLQSIPEETPFKLLVDFTSPDVGYSPYLRMIEEKIFQITKPRVGAIAFIVLTLQGQQFVTNMIRESGRPTYGYRFFNTQDVGLAWLRSTMETEDNST